MPNGRCGSAAGGSAGLLAWAPVRDILIDNFPINILRTHIPILGFVSGRLHSVFGMISCAKAEVKDKRLNASSIGSR